ncbi:hypothetical protein PsYK624_088530 [Phanerochaete sordida]|uniref:Uncharacterized protein n=1 Tax=Phanerochaete sordida TaxID=48140 RepID=A0A9P3LG45_9APHY|nr:hypothetical protein PsYK624_088530 [Phanerochaete sordida]
MELTHYVTLAAAADPEAVPPEVEAIIEAFATAIRTPMTFVIITMVFGSMLVPILVTLLWISTSTDRGQPIFILNVASILVGIGIATWSSYDSLYSILNPAMQVNKTANGVFAVVALLSPWIAELVLAYRLVAVFPPRRTPLWKLAAVFAYPVTIKCVRLGCMIAFWRVCFRETAHAANALVAAESLDWGKYPYSRAELFLQIFDNAYLSTVFIWKLNRSGQLFGQKHIQRVSLGAGVSFATRLKTLFWIAIGNFVIPVIFNIAIVIDIFVDPNYVLHASSLLLTDYYVSIIGVVFATVWSVSMSAEKPEPTVPIVRFQKTSKPSSTGLSNASRVGSSCDGEDPYGKARQWHSTEGVDSTDGAIPLEVFV